MYFYSLFTDVVANVQNSGDDKESSDDSSGEEQGKRSVLYDLFIELIHELTFVWAMNKAAKVHLLQTLIFIFVHYCPLFSTAKDERIEVDFRFDDFEKR